MDTGLILIGAMLMLDFGGAGLFVRADRLGSGALDDGEGMDTATGTGAGDDSFRRFAGLGSAAVGDGVGSDFAAEGGFEFGAELIALADTAVVEGGVALLAAAAALPERL